MYQASTSVDKKILNKIRFTDAALATELGELRNATLEPQGAKTPPVRSRQVSSAERLLGFKAMRSYQSHRRARSSFREQSENKVSNTVTESTNTVMQLDSFLYRCSEDSGSMRDSQSATPAGGKFRKKNWGREEDEADEEDCEEEQSDTVEASAFHGFLLPNRTITSDYLYTTEAFLKRAETSPNDERTIYLNGDEHQYDTTTAFIQALGLTTSPSSNDLEKKFLELFLKYGKLKPAGIRFRAANRIWISDPVNETFAYMQTWHYIIRKGFVSGLELCFNARHESTEGKTLGSGDVDGVFIEAISVTSMKFDGVKHMDVCTKAIHLASSYEDCEVACELVQLLLDNGADVNSLSLRTEDQDEGDESSTESDAEEEDIDEDEDESEGELEGEYEDVSDIDESNPASSPAT